MRKRINRNAICSSDNYKASRKAHLEMLKEHHKSFNVTMLSKSDTIDITKGEYEKHFKHLGFKILN